MKAKNGEAFIIKKELPEEDHYRKAYRKIWMPIEKEVAIARALSKLANKKFDDMRIVFEEPYGLIVTDEGKAGLFKQYPEHESHIAIEELDSIKQRITTQKQVKGEIQMLMTRFGKEWVELETIVKRIEGLYYPQRMAEIIMKANGISYTDYKPHIYIQDGKPTALVSDFEMVHLLKESKLADTIKHARTSITEKISSMNNFSFKELIESKQTIEEVVGQRAPSDFAESARDLNKLRNRRIKIYNRIAEHTGMQNPDDPNIKPGPAFEIINYIKHAKTNNLL